MAKSSAERQREYRQRKREAKIAQERAWLLDVFQMRGKKPPAWLTPNWRPSPKYWAWKGNLTKRLVAEEDERRRREDAARPSQPWIVPP
jgi:hypothetical protein